MFQYLNIYEEMYAHLCYVVCLSLYLNMYEVCEHCCYVVCIYIKYVLRYRFALKCVLLSLYNSQMLLFDTQPLVINHDN